MKRILLPLIISIPLILNAQSIISVDTLNSNELIIEIETTYSNGVKIQNEYLKENKHLLSTHYQKGDTIIYESFGLIKKEIDGKLEYSDKYNPPSRSKHIEHEGHSIFFDEQISYNKFGDTLEYMIYSNSPSLSIPDGSEQPFIKGISLYYTDSGIIQRRTEFVYYNVDQPQLQNSAVVWIPETEVLYSISALNASETRLNLKNFTFNRIGKQSSSTQITPQGIIKEFYYENGTLQRSCLYDVNSPFCEGVFDFPDENYYPETLQNLQDNFNFFEECSIISDKNVTVNIYKENLLSQIIKPNEIIFFDNQECIIYKHKVELNLLDYLELGFNEYVKRFPSLLFTQIAIQNKDSKVKKCKKTNPKSKITFYTEKNGLIVDSLFFQEGKLCSFKRFNGSKIIKHISWGKSDQNIINQFNSDNIPLGKWIFENRIKPHHSSLMDSILTMEIECHFDENGKPIHQWNFQLDYSNSLKASINFNRPTPLLKIFYDNGNIFEEKEIDREYFQTKFLKWIIHDYFNNDHKEINLKNFSYQDDQFDLFQIKHFIKQNGLIKKYYPNGKLMLKGSYSKYEYNNPVYREKCYTTNLIGTWSFYFENGQLQLEGSFYDCENCKEVLRPKEGDCCVFCSYGTVACPPIQQNKDCCNN